MPKTPPSPASLPQRADTWYLSARALKVWLVDDDGKPVHPHVILMINPANQLMLAMELAPRQPGLKAVRDLLVRTMRKPPRDIHQPPHRPRAVLFEQAELADGLHAELEEMGITVQVEPPGAMVDEIFAGLEKEMGAEEDQAVSLLASAGVSAALAGDLYAAAAAYYRKEPWIHLDNEQPVRFELPASGRTGYAQILGNGGLEYGILIYDDWADLEKSYLTANDPLEIIPDVGLASLSFSDAELIAGVELGAIEQYGWDLAGHSAYPLCMRLFKERVDPPDRQTVELFAALLRALPDFASMLEPDLEGDYHPFDQLSTAEVDGESVQIRLAYPAGTLNRAAFPAIGQVWDFEDEEEDEEDEDLSEDETFAEPEEEIEFEDEEARQAFEALVSSMEQEIAGAYPDPAQQQAQMLVLRAWNTDNPAERIQLARQALELWPDCADAYCLLAEELAVNIGQALKFYEKGVEAARRSLGEAYFSEHAGLFWDDVITRPFMRASEGLAHTLWDLDRNRQALEMFQELLRLDAHDHQGNRYSVLNLLIEMDRFAEALRFIEERPEPTATWLYTAALLEFQRSGDSPAARQRLEAALPANRHVLDYLTGGRKLPDAIPELIAPGGASEAIDYAASYGLYWRHTPGAVEWLKRLSRRQEKPDSKPRQAGGSKSRRSARKR